MEWLASLKATNTPLTVLDLSNNKISTPGALSLSQCLHGDVGSTESTCLARLVDLNLAGNPLGEDGVVALTARELSVLQALDLTDTKCGVAGAVTAVRDSRVASLRLFNNNLGPEGFRALEETLRGGHPTLVSLDLAGNRADEASVVVLLSALIIPDTSFESKLRTLIVGGNKGGPDVEAMIKRVKEVRPEIDIARDKIAKQNAE
jgi:Ran GTPase-activating protein (RanGAP) involved in mRNA processing and transport